MVPSSSDRSQSPFSIVLEAVCLTLTLGTIATLTSHPSQAKAALQPAGTTPACIEIALQEKLTARVITHAVCR